MLLGIFVGFGSRRGAHRTPLLLRGGGYSALMGLVTPSGSIRIMREQRHARPGTPPARLLGQTEPRLSAALANLLKREGWFTFKNFPA
jgi:hypothetical protein